MNSSLKLLFLVTHARDLRRCYQELSQHPVYMENNQPYNDTSATMRANASDPEKQLIDMIYPPILLTFGVSFNTMIIMVMRSRYFRKQSTSVYMTAGAVNDALSLFISMTTHWLYVSFDDVYDRDKVRGICKFLDFYGWGNCDFGILITTAMTVDRATAISFPLKQASRDKIRRARIVVFIMATIVIVKEFHFLIGSDMVKQDQKERLCDIVPLTDAYRFFWIKVWPWLHFSFLALCFVIIIVSNGILLYFVWKSAKLSSTGGLEMRKSNNQIERIDKQWKTLTPMLIGESFVLLVFTFPFTVHLWIAGNRPDFYDSNVGRLVFSITFYMLYTNKCITFIVYLITGSRFRKALQECFYVCINGRQAGRRKRFQQTFFKSMFGLNSNDQHSRPSLDFSGESSFENEKNGKSANDVTAGNGDSNSASTDSTHL